MKKSPNELVSLIQQVLSPNQFTRRGATWLRAVGGIIQVIDLQKSSFGRQFYLNIGLWIEGAEPLPRKLREQDLHVRLRVDVALAKVDGLRLSAALDLENEMAITERESVIADTFHQTILPWLSEWSSPEQVGSAILVSPLTGALVTREARALVPNPPP